jgi:flagellar biosynthetic protein FlhB
MAHRQFRLDQLLVIQRSMAGTHAEMLWPLIADLLKETLAWLAPFACTVMIAAVVGNAMQTGPVLSVEPVVADFNRLNPANGIKRVLSVRALFDAARACIKLCLLIGAAYFSLKELAPQFYSLSGLSPLGYLKTLISDLASLGFRMALLMAIIAAVDWVFTRREFARKMRMSKREVKDEHKQREGDPRVRARLRDLQREARKRSKSLRQTRNADVVLTNPTHVAVALRYVHGEMDSPQVVAKGAGHLAAAMRHIAARHRIPVVRSPALARRLFRELDVEHHVPPHLFADVARIIVWIFAMRERSPAAAGAAR